MTEQTIWKCSYCDKQYPGIPNYKCDNPECDCAMCSQCYDDIYLK